MRVVKCSDPDRFQPAGYWASQGLETEDEVRWELLWQAATSDTDIAKQTAEHADGCDYCGDVLDRFRRVAYAMKPSGTVQLAICPSAGDLVGYLKKTLPPEVSEKVAAHARKCRNCTRELKWLVKSEKQSHHPVILTRQAKIITVLAAAAMLLIGAVVFVTVSKRSTYTPIEDRVYNTRYSDLARLPLLDRADLIKASPPSHWQSLDRAMSALELGDSRRAVGLAARMINDKDEPAAEYILGRALYRERMVAAANEALLKSERMQPMSDYRCWSALQIALILGEKDVIMRECKHLENNPQYGEQARRIRDEVNRRG